MESNDGANPFESKQRNELNQEQPGHKKPSRRMAIVAIVVLLSVIIVSAVAIVFLANRKPTAKFNEQKHGEDETIESESSNYKSVDYSELADCCEEFAVNAKLKKNLDFLA